MFQRDVQNPVCINVKLHELRALTAYFSAWCLCNWLLACVRSSFYQKSCRATQSNDTAQHTTAIHQKYSKQNWFAHLTSWEYGATHVRSTVFSVNNLSFRNCQKNQTQIFCPNARTNNHGNSHIKTIFVKILLMWTIFVNIHCMLWNVDWRTKYCGSEKQVSGIECFARDTWSLVAQAWIWLCKKKRVSLFVAVSFDVVEYLFCDRVIKCFCNEKLGLLSSSIGCEWGISV